MSPPSFTLVIRENESPIMPQPTIKFGTDGWRAVIADDYTFANVRIAAEAIAAYVHAKEDPAGSNHDTEHTSGTHLLITSHATRHDALRPRNAQAILIPRHDKISD